MKSFQEIEMKYLEEEALKKNYTYIMWTSVALADQQPHWSHIEYEMGSYLKGRSEVVVFTRKAGGYVRKGFGAVDVAWSPVGVSAMEQSLWS